MALDKMKFRKYSFTTKMLLILAACSGANIAHAESSLQNVSSIGTQVESPALMPLPASAQFPGGFIPFSGRVTVSWENAPTPVLKKAVARFIGRANALAGDNSSRQEKRHPALHLRISYGKDPDWLSVHAKESYTLTSGPKGVVLTASGPAGVLHGLATLTQLIGHDAQGGKIFLANISDAPRFAWRGIMIDTSRHFMDVSTIKRQMDAMEMLKLNVLHFHLSDGAGFRVESRVLPELTQKGTSGQYYTQEQIRDLIVYAADRGIRVVPEFDVPGHAMAFLLAHPELAARRPVDLNVKNKNNPALDPTLPETLEFVTQLYAEMGSLFPDAYFHAGGDEVSPSEWTKNPEIVAFMKKNGFETTQELQADFTAKVQKILEKQKKIMIGWDEISEAPISSNVVVDVWRSSKFISSATAAHHPVIVSAGYYLDLLQPSSQYYQVDPFDPSANGITEQQAAAWLKKGTRPSLVDAFRKDTTLGPLTDEQKSYILGGEAPLWSELVTDEMLDARLWPRAAAVAERFWSPAGVRDVGDMYRRLESIDKNLQVTALNSEINVKRMTKRLSPANSDPVMVLATATAPLRSYKMNRYVAHRGNRLDEIGETVSPDSFSAVRFGFLVDRYLAGDKSTVSEMRKMLQEWKDNDPAFLKIATSSGLSDAVSTSHDLAVIAGAGLDALDGQKNLSKDSQVIFDRQDAMLTSGDDVSGAGAITEFPGGGLIVVIEPSVRKLLGSSNGVSSAK